MRNTLCGAIALLAATAWPLMAFAQTYPDKPIRVIVPVPAGGTPDVVARMVAPGLSSLLGQQLVIDNRGGAGGLIGGSVNLMFNSIPPAIQHIKAGRLRLLAVSTAKRSPQLPDAPTVSEAGVPGYECITWFGLLAPAKTPSAILARLHRDIVKVVHAPEMKAQLEIQGYDAVGGGPAEFAAFIRAESEKYAKVIKLSGAKVD